MIRLAALSLSALATAMGDAPAVTSQTMRAASDKLKKSVEDQEDAIHNADVKRAVGEGFTYFEEQGFTQTMTYSADKTDVLTPIVQQILNAPKNCATAIKVSLLAAEYVTDGAGQRWSHHTMMYSNKASEQDGTGFAQLVVHTTEQRPTERTLYMFKLKSGFSLASDIVYLRSCTAHAGFLGLGAHSECHDVPTEIPHTLDMVSLKILDDYLTAVGLKLLSNMLGPNGHTGAALAAPPAMQTGSVPAAFAGMIAGLRKRGPACQQALACRHCSPQVRELVTKGFKKLESTLSENILQQLPRPGAEMIIREEASDVGLQFIKVLESVLASTVPVVYSGMSCNEKANCTYLFVCGRTVNNLTDLIVAQASAAFELVPHLMVVRETHVTAHNDTVTQDRIHEVPRKVAQADVDALLAFFEVQVVESLNRGSSLKRLLPLADKPVRTPSLSPAPSPSPSMPGSSPQDVPEWQQLLSTLANNTDLIDKVTKSIQAISASSSGATAAAAVGGLAGVSELGWVGGVLAAIPLIQAIFHHSSSHTSQFVQEIQNAGFDHFGMDAVGPLVMTDVPLHHMQDGKDIKPAKMVLTQLMGGSNSYLNDFPDEKERDRIKEWVPMLAEGWLGRDAQFPFHHWMYSSKDGGNMRSVMLSINVNQTAITPEGTMGTMTCYFYSVSSSLKLADRLMVYRITDTYENFFSSGSKSRDEIRHMPASITAQDILAFQMFINVLMGVDLAKNLNLCQMAPDQCRLPPSKPNSTRLAPQLGKLLRATTSRDRCYAWNPAYQSSCAQLDEQLCKAQSACRWGQPSQASCDGQTPDMDSKCRTFTGQSTCSAQIGCVWRSPEDLTKWSDAINQGTKALDASAPSLPSGLLVGSPTVSVAHDHAQVPTDHVQDIVSAWESKYNLAGDAISGLNALIAAESVTYKSFHIMVKGDTGVLQEVAAGGRNWGGIVSLAFVTAHASIEVSLSDCDRMQMSCSPRCDASSGPLMPGQDRSADFRRSFSRSCHCQRGSDGRLRARVLYQNADTQKGTCNGDWILKGSSAISKCSTQRRSGGDTFACSCRCPSRGPDSDELEKVVGYLQHAAYPKLQAEMTILQAELQPRSNNVRQALFI